MSYVFRYLLTYDRNQYLLLYIICNPSQQINIIYYVLLVMFMYLLFPSTHRVNKYSNVML